MDIIFISNQIKFDVLNICGKPSARAYNLLTDTPLHTMGYQENNDFCRQLEYQLQQIANEYKTGKSINSGAVSKNLTVRECIEMVMV